MLPELGVTQTSLSPGHLRLTWNSMGIKEFIQAGNQKISSLISKIRQIEILRLQLQEIIDYVEHKQLLKYEDTGDKKADAGLPTFETFFQSKYEYLESMYKDLLEKVSLMAPLLIKVEEILVATRTQRAPRLSSYYLHWERKLFEAVGKSTLKRIIYVILIITAKKYMLGRAQPLTNNAQNTTWVRNIARCRFAKTIFN